MTDKKELLEKIRSDKVLAFIDAMMKELSKKHNERIVEINKENGFDEPLFTAEFPRHTQ